MSAIDPDVFHAHLDKCAQCREHPFSLCKEGERLLMQAATGIDPAHAAKLAAEAKAWETGAMKPTDPGWVDSPQSIPSVMVCGSTVTVGRRCLKCGKRFTSAVCPCEYSS